MKPRRRPRAGEAVGRRAGSPRWPRRSAQQVVDRRSQVPVGSVTVPPAECVDRAMSTVFHEFDQSGWWPLASASSATLVMNAKASEKSANRNCRRSAPSRSTHSSSAACPDLRPGGRIPPSAEDVVDTLGVRGRCAAQLRELLPRRRRGRGTARARPRGARLDGVVRPRAQRWSAVVGRDPRQHPPVRRLRVRHEHVVAAFPGCQRRARVRRRARQAGAARPRRRSGAGRPPATGPLRDPARRRPRR